jgi:hypothetical protein
VCEVKLVENGFEYALKIGQNVVAPETDDVIPACFQRHRTTIVRRDALDMLPTINLDNQFPFQGDKVDDESRERDLPFDFDTIELTRAKSRPKQTLGFDEIFAESPSVPTQRLSPLTLPSPLPKSDISDFGRPEVPNSGEPEFGWGEGHFT